jgi:uncharacterized protein
MSDADDFLDDERIDYQALLLASLRDALRRLLAKVAEEGLPGEHYFYLTFRTDHPDVDIPRFLKEQYPEEMTIILQNQYWGLAVEDDSFSVLLSFHGTKHRLSIPFRALTIFFDPSVPFALRVDGRGGVELAGEDEDVEPEPPDPQPPDPVAGGEVLPFARPRRK